MRLAVIATPRAGGTWLRMILEACYDLAPVDLGAADELPDLSRVPAGSVLHLHIPHSPDTEARLRLHGCGVVTTVRHPLDVLVSYLSYRQDAGASIDPLASLLVDATPASGSFVGWACSDHARRLLAISASWWGQGDAIGARYETLLDQPSEAVSRLVDELGAPPVRSIAQVLEAAAPDALRSRTRINHFLRMRSGGWRDVIPAHNVRAIVDAHRDFFDRFGYVADPDADLSVDRAEREWYRWRAEAASSHARFLGARLERLETDHAALVSRGEALRAQTERFGSLGPRSLRVARAAQRLAEAARRVWSHGRRA